MREAGLKSGKSFQDKYNKDADTAIKQIKEKRYHGALEGYTDRVLLVGVSYDSESADKKKHRCEIEEIIGEFF